MKIVRSWGHASGTRAAPVNGISRGPPAVSGQGQTADRWTWLIIVAHTQLRLARPLAENVRRP